MPTENGITGAEVARRLLDSRGLQAVKIEATPGMLTDHYDPPLQNPTTQPRRLFHTECSGGWDCGS
jgi:Zn-dependent membrane protease YugP